MPRININYILPALNKVLTITRSTIETTASDLSLGDFTKNVFSSNQSKRTFRTTLTLTGKTTGRVLRFITENGDAAGADLFKRRILDAFSDDLPEGEDALLDRLADYFDEVTATKDVPHDVLLLLVDNEGIVDLIGLPDENDRKVLVVQNPEQDVLGYAQQLLPMNRNADQRSTILDHYHETMRRPSQTYEDVVAERDAHQKSDMQ